MILATGADPNGKVNIIVHGYSEDCSQPWVTQMLCSKILTTVYQNISKIFLPLDLNTYRPGATFCMDYSFYANDPVFSFFRNVNNITQVLVNKYQQMEAQGFDLSQFMVFAFSAGTSVAIKAGAALGGRIGQMFGEARRQ